MCSDFPTQLAIGTIITAMGVRPQLPGGELSPVFVFAVSGIDTVVLLGLIFAFLKMSGDRARDIFLGTRPAAPEIAFGVLTVPLVFALVVGLQLTIRVLAPSLRNVPVSPFMSLLQTPALFMGFVFVVLIAGAVREELARAFVLHRFEQKLGGARVGLFVMSAAFGLGHTVQGWDAAIVTGLLGFTWGVLYLARRSVVSTLTSHGLFNLAQILVGYATLTRT